MNSNAYIKSLFKTVTRTGDYMETWLQIVKLSLGGHIKKERTGGSIYY